MAEVERLDGKGVLRFKDGSIVDDFLFENDPLDSTFNEVKNKPREEIDALMNKILNADKV